MAEEVVLYGLTAYGMHEGRMARQESKKAAEKDTQIQQLQANRERVQRIREARLKRAVVESQSAATGTTTSSGFEGASASIGSQLASSTSFLNQASALSREKSIFEIEAASRSDVGQAAIAFAPIAKKATTWLKSKPWNTP